MSDEPEIVDAGSEPSSEETPVETPAVETPDVPEVETPVDAGGAAEPTPEAPADESRTGYAEKGLRAGDACTCPDGRTGTVHQYDAGLICMPNQDQG
jgi:hypothetical protein